MTSAWGPLWLRGVDRDLVSVPSVIQCAVAGHIPLWPTVGLPMGAGGPNGKGKGEYLNRTSLRFMLFCKTQLCTPV